MRRYCLDASALVIYIVEQRRDPDLDSAMTEIEEGRSEGIISTVNLAEFHRALTRIASEEDADRYVVWIRESRISIIPPDIDTAIMSSVKKHSYARASSPFAWGDAFCLSTALNNNADVLITADREFDKVTDISIMKI